MRRGMWTLLKEFVVPYRYHLLFAFVLVLGINAFSIIEPMLVRNSIDKYIYRRAIFVPDTLIDSTIKIGKPLLKYKEGHFYKYADIPSYYRKIVEKRSVLRNIIYFPDIDSVKIKEYVARGNGYVFVKASDMNKIPLSDVLKLRRKDFQRLKFIGIVLVSLAIMKFLFSYIYQFVLTYISHKTMHDLRMKIMRHLIYQPLSFYTDHQVGWLVTRSTNDVQALANFFSGFVVNVAKDSLLLIGLFVILFKINVRIGFVMFLSLPVFAIILYIFQKFFYAAYDRVRKHLSRINAFVQESLNGVKIIQAFSMVKKRFNDFSKVSEDYFDALISQLNVMSVFRPIFDVLNFVMLGILVIYGGILIMSGNVSIGTIVLAFSYAQMIFKPIANISENFNLLQSTRAAVNRIDKILSYPTEKSGSITKKIEGKVELENVSFAYVDDEYVLKDVNLKADKGEAIAIVGATGSGKTTIINLIMGFYVPQKGRVMIDDIEVKDYNYDYLRKSVGLVMQDIFIVEGSLAENIALEDDYDLKKIEEIGKIIGLDEVVKKYENGYLMHVNEGGTNLSVGERQLVAFARTMYKDPTILILDEATSSVDSHTERLIQKATEEVMKGRTSIVIAHRLSTIRNADRIYVLREGKIIEEGNHKSLIEKKGYYYTLYMGKGIT